MTSRSTSLRSLLPVASFFAALATSGVAHAQTVPAGTASTQKATTGVTDLTSAGFEAARKDADKDKKDATDASISAGGLVSSGNSPSTSVTAAIRFRIRRDASQFTAAAAYNYGQGPVKDANGNNILDSNGSPIKATTLDNLQARIRYDYFIGDNFTLFLGAQARHDLFQDLELRTQVDPGIGYYFVASKDRNVWIELGYDYLHDIRNTDDTGCVLSYTGDCAGVNASKTLTSHSVRGFIGYNEIFNQGVSFVTTLEFLQAINSADYTDTSGNAQSIHPYRIAFDALLNAKLSTKFALGLGLSARYDSGAVIVGKKELDTISTVSLNYTIQ
jgi:putative salt-induced outer membrane protein